MLDIRFIREHPDLVQEGARKKHIDIDVQHLLAVDEQRRQLIARVESFKALRNKTSKDIPTLQGEARQEAIAHMKRVAEESKELESTLREAEVPVTAYHAEEILREDELPKYYVGLSTCYRREAGTYGKDTRGLFRIHQFQKVEQVVICANDPAVSSQEHEHILHNAEEILQALGLPYRVVLVCGGDLGVPQIKKYDIETWMPSRNAYSETHSASKFHDFQARRLKLRYRGQDGTIRFAHTLNNTVIASPRILIPLLELYQRADGSIAIPPVLQPYMGGLQAIVPS